MVDIKALLTKKEEEKRKKIEEILEEVMKEIGEFLDEEIESLCEESSDFILIQVHKGLVVSNLDFESKKIKIIKVFTTEKEANFFAEKLKEVLVSQGMKIENKETDTFNLRLNRVAEILQTKNSQIYRTNEKIDVYEEVYKDFKYYRISLD